MTQDEIIRMARDAGGDPLNSTGEPICFRAEGLERFAALVAANEAEKWKVENKRDYENWKMAAEKAAECEREACAKVCEEIDDNFDYTIAARQCAAAIRARGEK